MATLHKMVKEPRQKQEHSALKGNPAELTWLIVTLSGLFWVDWLVLVGILMI
jgi:hypothetical protein